MRTQIIYAALVISLGVASAAVGQTSQAEQLPLKMRAPSAASMQPATPEQLAKIQQTAQLGYAAAADLHLGNYVQAEAEARESLSVNSMNGASAEVLAAALEGQGKDQEALEAYRVMVVDEKATYPRVLLPYAQLLLKSGQWGKAVAIYNQVLPHLPSVGPHPETPIIQDGDLIAANSYFSPDVPEPAALAVALHIARGMVLDATPGWAGTGQETEAMAEYGKALQLAPDNALANYYYGVGWHKLSPAERIKFGQSTQAKAALQKAAQLGDPSIKKMAEETLKKSN
jgi:tetratricopeptide (TPR) repeat protein